MQVRFFTFIFFVSILIFLPSSGFADYSVPYQSSDLDTSGSSLQSGSICNITDCINDFIASVKDLSMFNLGMGDISGYSSSGDSQFVFSTSGFGDLTFDFANYGVVFYYANIFVLIVASLVAVRIVVLKK